MARRCDEAQAEPFQIVEGIAERVDFQLAAVARTGVDLAYREAAAEPSSRRPVEPEAKLGELIERGLRPGFAQCRPEHVQKQKLAHLEIVPRIRAVERLVAQREVGDDVAFDDCLEERPLEPRRIAQVTARNPALAADPHPGEDIAAKGFDEAQPFPTLPASPGSAVDPDRAPGSRASSWPISERLCSTSRMRIHTRALTSPSSHRHVEIELVVGRIGDVRGAHRRRVPTRARHSLRPRSGLPAPASERPSSPCDPGARRYCRTAPQCRGTAGGFLDEDLTGAARARDQRQRRPE